MCTHTMNIRFGNKTRCDSDRGRVRCGRREAVVGAPPPCRAVVPSVELGLGAVEDGGGEKLRV
jgi:hypothetical protein